MKSLTTGFFYIVGFSWALAETCVMASNGSWLPLVLFLVLFTLMFSILGCIRISNQAAEFWGGFFALILAVGLVYLSAYSFYVGSNALGALKALFSVSFVVMGVFAFVSGLKALKSH